MDAAGNLQADRMTATGVIKDSFAPEALQSGQVAVTALMQNGLLTITNQPAIQAALNAPTPNGGALTYKDDSGRVTLTLAGEAKVQAVYNQLKLTETFDVKHFADQGTAQVVTLVAAIALTVMSGGTGAAMIGATAGTASAAAANAAFIAMASTMTGQLAAGASFDEAFQVALKAGTSSAITAGILNTQMIDTAQGMRSINQLANVQTTGANIVGNFNADTFGQNLLGIGARGVVSAGVNSTIYGGSFGDAFKASVVGDLAAVGANAVGQGTRSLSLGNVLGHAAVGCAAAAANGKDCASGAIGGAGAAIANTLLDQAIGGADGSGWGSNPETAQQWQTATLQLGSMGASAAAAAALGKDGMTAALAAQNETVNNYLSQKRTSPPALSEQEQLNEAIKRGDTATAKRLMELSVEKDKLLANVCGSGSPQGCNTEVRAAIDAGNIVMRAADGRVIAIPADSPVIKAPDRPMGFDTQLAPSLADAILMEGSGILLKGASFVGARLIGVSGEGFVPGVAVTNSKVVYPGGLAYRSDLPEHLAGPDGFTKSGQLSGTHNLQNATAALDAQGASYKLTPTGTTGISELQYSYSNAAGKTITGSKTVYDPSVYSNQSILDMSQAAGQRGYEAYLKDTSQRIFDVNHGGVNFRTYINIDPKTGMPFVGNIHPIK